ncbi:MAG: F0F1 ATP synthase subunit A [Candidatus Paceibacterota bacterium]
MATELHISISAERVFSFGPLNISNSMLTSLIVSGLLILFFVAVNRSLDPKAKKPKALQNLAEFMVEGFFGLVQGVTGDEQKTRFFLPYFMSFFLFIMLNNWFGLLPGVGTIGFTQSETGTEHAVLLDKEISAPISSVQASQPVEEELVVEHGILNESEVELEDAESMSAEHGKEGVFVPYFRAGTADLNTTIALSLTTMAIIQFAGVKYLGLAYFKKFFDLRSPILFVVSILESISEVAKIISFSFRLFGNIFAGEVLLVVIGSLVPIIAPLPFYGLEIFVGFIQAFVFALLSLVFFNIAVAGHDEH